MENTRCQGENWRKRAQIVSGSGSESELDSFPGLQVGQSLWVLGRARWAKHLTKARRGSRVLCLAVCAHYRFLDRLCITVTLEAHVTWRKMDDLLNVYACMIVVLRACVRPAVVLL